MPDFLPLYLRYEKSSEPDAPHNAVDVCAYRDDGMTRFAGRWPYWQSQKPGPRSHVVTFNCYKWRVVWKATPRAYMAAREYDRIKGLAAFTVAGAAWSKRLNQHATLYHFPDESRLCLYHTKGRADAWSMKPYSAPYLTPLIGVPYRATTRGVAA